MTNISYDFNEDGQCHIRICVVQEKAASVVIDKVSLIIETISSYMSTRIYMAQSRLISYM